MFVDLTKISNKKLTIGVAVSGGSDSMALLHYLFSQKDKHNFKVVAVNVEHGIRGEDSISDSQFVKNYCDNIGVDVLSYSVDSIKYAKENKLSIEQSARALRYECFYDAINKGLCDKIATAHHVGDNVESVLFNLFRGTGIKGLKGIMPNYKDFIIRPLISTSKSEIEEYVKENNIPTVLDKTNLSDKYTRNYIRLNILPKIKEIFPDVENSILRLTNVVREEDEYLDKEAQKTIIEKGKELLISVSTPPVLFKRAVIISLKKMGIEKDWENIHVEDVFSLTDKENGKYITLPKNIIAVRENDVIKICKNPLDKLTKDSNDKVIDFSVGEFDINNVIYKVEYSDEKELNDYLSNKTTKQKALFLDGDKIPKNAVIRTRRKGDTFTPFGGGRRSLSDFFTDKKIDKIKRDTTPVIAIDNEIYAIFGIEISSKVKVTPNTKKIIKLT